MRLTIRRRSEEKTSKHFSHSHDKNWFHLERLVALRLPVFEAGTWRPFPRHVAQQYLIYCSHMPDCNTNWQFAYSGKSKHCSVMAVASFGAAVDVNVAVVVVALVDDTGGAVVSDGTR